ncbi:hypothetical protein [Lysobacter sp. A3-1-A15]|uniref:hypothetical protein n=1 Tax=Novilysobacter viscosus TaxID=3098602 RepID=UPI002EDB2659
MRIPMMSLSTLALVLALSACRDNSDLEPDVDAAPVVMEDAADDAAGPGVRLDAASYSCDDDHRVTVDGDTAQVTLADGREVALSRSAGEITAVFTGEALEFTGDSEGGTLLQDEGGSYTCRAD